jgi:hypothetical protein
MLSCTSGPTPQSLGLDMTVLGPGFSSEPGSLLETESLRVIPANELKDPKPPV